MNTLDLSTYLEDFSEQLKDNLPDDVYSCEVYGGQLEDDASEYLNFNVNKKAQCFISMDEIILDQGVNLLGDASFAVFVVAITDPRTKGFSLKGLTISQKISGFINNSDNFNEGTAGRPKIVSMTQLTNKIKDKKLYNIFRIVYSQRIILKQDYT